MDVWLSYCRFLLTGAVLVRGLVTVAVEELVFTCDTTMMVFCVRITGSVIRGWKKNPQPDI